MQSTFEKKPLPGEIHTPVRHIDHATYVTALEKEKDFIDTWAKLGFVEHWRGDCVRYPATHIALVSGVSDEYPWATMTGLSISDDPGSPVNEFVRRYGPGLQHVAYNIGPNSDMDDVYEKMKENNWDFMTPVLTYHDGNEGRLRQMFIAPTIPFGPFTEFIQRLPGKDGKPYSGFDQMNIDDLYEEYENYSKSLDSKK
ncbi:MAG: hypothetical protein P9L92_06715 [Candidatus Electryonea clarkiae]|nr:hypothetical protein [Candidatus Electryonea clarkiae]MDP8286733.1 hypothetical protein [Candidatus Electryonea clarkiae]